MEKSAIFLASQCDLALVRPEAGPVKCPDPVRSVGTGAGSVVTSRGKETSVRTSGYGGKKADKYLQTNLQHTAACAEKQDLDDEQRS